MDNPVVHGLYTFIALCLDNVSTILAVTLMGLQLIVVAPKAWNTIKRWRKNGKK